MIEPLNKSKLEYIFYHLNRHIDLKGLSEFFIFDLSEKNLEKPFIFFRQSDKALSKNFQIDDISVLFPLSEQKSFYNFDDSQNLYFNHDLLKSAFYLLSGFQETLPFKGDHMGRFSYDDSIQKELEIAEKPLVNIYFSIIADAFKQFCYKHNLKLSERKYWDNKDYGFFLTHDVDRVDKWTSMELKKRIKMVIKSGFLKHWSYLFEALGSFNRSENPYWNFEWMKNLELKKGFKSTWFFLPRGHKQIDAWYSFDEPRIKNLADFFLKAGDSIGMHATFLSKEDINVMAENLKSVRSMIETEIVISRQHWLNFKYPQTLRNLEKLGIKFDSSWGFSGNIGWRNSYCCPFRPYDMEQDRMMDIWELPLTVMDVTLFQYMGLSLNQAEERLLKVIDTCRRYNGIMVLLWHNSHFDETLIPGITMFYQKILDHISQSLQKSLTLDDIQKVTQ